jgi:hypothetical protein
MRVVAARALELDLDALERRQRDAHHLRCDLAHVLAVLVRKDVVVGRNVDGERRATRWSALAVRQLDLLAAIDPAHVLTVIVTS